MRRAKLVAETLVATALLGVTLVLVGFLMAETPSPSAHAALTGKVTSQAEGAMEGLHYHHLGGQQRPGPVQFPARQNGTRQIFNQGSGRGI